MTNNSGNGNKTALELLRELFEHYHATAQDDIAALNTAVGELRERLDVFGDALDPEDIERALELLATIDKSRSDMEYKCTPLKIHEMNEHKMGGKERAAIITAVVTGTASLLIIFVRELLNWLFGT
jgi:hypothetical protein